jgi:hypothetical protein
VDQPTQGKHRTVSRLTPVGTAQLEKFRLADCELAVDHPGLVDHPADAEDPTSGCLMIAAVPSTPEDPVVVQGEGAASQFGKVALSSRTTTVSRRISATSPRALSLSALRTREDGGHVIAVAVINPRATICSSAGKAGSLMDR